MSLRGVCRATLLGAVRHPRQRRRLVDRPALRPAAHHARSPRAGLHNNKHDNK